MNAVDKIQHKSGQNHPARSSNGIPRVLAAEMKKISATGKCTKRTAARLAISNTIRADILKPGDFLPSEKQLTGILGVSLGTVQAALGQLQDMGTIIRRRGDGTRVTALEPHTDATWHFRFLSKRDQTPLRIKDEKLRIETTTQTGIWSQHLGRSDLYLRIWRKITMWDGTLAGAEMFLTHSAASALTSIDASELQMANIRPYLEHKLGLVTRDATHIVKTIILDKAAAARFDLQPLEEYFEIHAKTHSPDRQPVYFQRIFVSSSDCILVF
jgi:GntR family transcriptional regulator